MNQPATASTTTRVTGWDRTAVVLLGVAGCALSFSALQQMALAIHIRPLLSPLFPLVIDGFIAYGVRALLVLRTAPLPARLYVWTLFGTATAVSVWANALHAVRLNTAIPGRDTALGLGGTVVAVLSTVAPLALAGAVHLYILIARGPDNRRPVTGTGRHGRSGHLEPGQVKEADRPGHRELGQSVDRTGRTGHHRTPVTRRLISDGDLVDGVQEGTGHPDTADKADDVHGQSDTAPPVTGHPASTEPVTDHRGSLPPATGPDSRTPGERRPDPDTEELLEIARSAVRAEDKLTRRVVAQAIRGQQIPLSNDTLTALMVQLRQQPGQPVTSTKN